MSLNLKCEYVLSLTDIQIVGRFKCLNLCYADIPRSVKSVLKKSEKSKNATEISHDKRKNTINTEGKLKSENTKQRGI